MVTVVVTPATTARLVFDLHEIFEDAAERAGMELRTGFDFKSMRRSLAFLLREWANAGYNLYSLQEVSITYTAGVASVPLPSDCIDVMDVVVRQSPGLTSQIDLNLSRTSLADYRVQSNKLSRGRPTQFVVDRLTSPLLTVWPVPNIDYTVVYWYMRHLAEPTLGDGVPGIPDRFVPALISGLAYHLALKRPPLADRAAGLKEEYDRQWRLATEEDRDRASMYIRPALP